MTVKKKTVLCQPDAQGVLFPHNAGTVPVFLMRQNNEGDVPTGTISWLGCVRAFITFDISGKNAIGYNCTDMTLTSHITCMSIENLLPHMAI